MFYCDVMEARPLTTSSNPMTDFIFRYNFSLEFKTAAPDGMLFYVTDAVRQTDYIALYLMGGNIVYTFDCGSGAARMVSPSTYNDGQWHKVSCQPT